MEQDWYKYVYRYSEGLGVFSSGITLYLLKLCPDYINNTAQSEMMEALHRLEPQAGEHITIYRAIKYASELNPHSVVRQEARDILGRVNKPTTYQRFVSKTVQIAEDDEG